MTDIKRYLRCARSGDMLPDNFGAWCKYDEAADEIERLREVNALNVANWQMLCDEKQAEIERLRAHIAELEAWQQNGQKLFDNYAVGLGTMFGLGKWWGERPWGKR